METGEWHMKATIESKDIFFILAASFCFMASPMLVTPLITGFSGSIGASAALMGIIGGLTNLCSLLCRPLVGNLADRVSKYRMCFLGAGLAALACVGYIAAFHPGLVIAARVVNGVGYACSSVCVSTWLSNLLPKEKISSGMGFYGMMNALAMAVAPAIGISVYHALGYHAAFGAALAFALGAALLIQFVKDKGIPEPARAVAEPQQEKARVHIVDGRVLPIALIVMLFAIPYCATQSFLISYVQARAISVSVSLYFPMYAAVLLLLRLFLKNWFDRLPFRVFLAGGLASALAGMLCLGWMHSNVQMFFAAAFMAGGYGIMCSVSQSTAMLLADKEQRGLANSTYYIGLDLGMTLGPAIGGMLCGHVPIALFYPVLLITLPLAALVYFICRRYSGI